MQTFYVFCSNRVTHRNEFLTVRASDQAAALAHLRAECPELRVLSVTQPTVRALRRLEQRELVDA